MTAARVHLISPDKLSNDLIGVWRSHQAADENLRGPFFSPEYVRVAASARPEVTVAVIETPGYTWSPESVIRGCGLSGWDFTNIVTSDQTMEPYFRAYADSPFADLSGRLRCFRQGSRASGIGSREIGRPEGQEEGA